MLSLTGTQVECICNDWRGNQGGTLSLSEITNKYGLTPNEAYSVLSSTDSKNTMTYRKKVGLIVRAYGGKFVKEQD
jgi:hypothetical protein